MPEVLKRGMRNLVAIDSLIDVLESQGFYKNRRYDHVFSAAVEDAVIYFQQTHLGPDERPLVPDGVVGPNTWWALRHPSGKAQKSDLIPTIPDGITGAREKVLKVAIAEHQKNVREIPNGSNRGPEVDKYFPKWWLDSHGPKEKGLAWCCYSAHWVYHEALGVYPVGQLTGSCALLARKAQEAGIWYLAGQQLIRPGDLFLILHPKKPGQPQTGHVGYVLCTDADDTLEFGTLEGNCGNRYKCGMRDVPDISGFINPYDLHNQPISFGHSVPYGRKVAVEDTR